ncbi:FMN-binding negative transcriptional regulator [Antarcticimicrobium luteum]|uniref:FMN-binding negative transcriptional regulator n=1 Tax=Antarcticimicrobium luteum TaxID=2547397 RepID=A0A4R5VD37_9RHOB|nr:FMN-binding negative transcriptional regulator [Antarcticimicrobium luteum]TDK50021.1 FMN-binding negative transcriptional regulator [Antarcticimicrobium luteum]
MHPNPIYRTADAARNIGFARARARGFGVLAVADPAGVAPMLSHVPFVLSDDGAMAELHLVRSNPIARALQSPLPARLAVSGPDSYISPDWYGMEDQVPTWNYVAVHLTGRLELCPQEELRGFLDRLSAQFEARLAPKPEWRADKVDRAALDRMMRMIVPARLHVDGIDGTWKLAQNRPGAARLAAADGVAETGIGAELSALAELMRDVPEE